MPHMLIIEGDEIQGWSIEEFDHSCLMFTWSTSFTFVACAVTYQGIDTVFPHSELTLSNLEVVKTTSVDQFV